MLKNNLDDPILSVRELQKTDINLILDYWLLSPDAFLEGMGVDLKKMPARDEFFEMLSEQLTQDYKDKKSYCIIWQINGTPVGHSNVNKIIYGEQAFMHLHLWESSIRTKGFGTSFVKKTVPYFFKNLKLKNLYCEPFALNPSPNKTLKKAGFKFVKEYITTPGFLNFEQPVNLWELKEVVSSQ